MYFIQFSISYTCTQILVNHFPQRIIFLINNNNYTIILFNCNHCNYYVFFNQGTFFWMTHLYRYLGSLTYLLPVYVFFKNVIINENILLKYWFYIVYEFYCNESILVVKILIPFAFIMLIYIWINFKLHEPNMIICKTRSLRKHKIYEFKYILYTTSVIVHIVYIYIFFFS